jgi:hypothetical protein
MEYCLAVKKDGTVVAWGEAPPVPTGLSGITEVAAGQDHCLALTSGGTIIGWGANDSGQTQVPANAGTASLLGAGWNYSVALVPNNSSAPSTFRLTDFAWGSGSFSASVLTQANKHYVLQYKGSMDEPTWVSLAPVAGNGQLMRLTDAAASVSHRLYRVQQQ